MAPAAVRKSWAIAAQVVGELVRQDHIIAILSRTASSFQHPIDPELHGLLRNSNPFLACLRSLQELPSPSHVDLVRECKQLHTLRLDLGVIIMLLIYRGRHRHTLDIIRPRHLMRQCQNHSHHLDHRMIHVLRDSPHSHRPIPVYVLCHPSCYLLQPRKNIPRWPTAS
ncbi:hypothetical protein Pan181_47780 [Aeoliella mucimassa]|uniref:Uncharacterized protein n=1 Tax=Aeoliella mucimassa TaxID=2527972 RepID=A0A518AV01_9BACT|nr:hypothetical protein Pan181_47780 [Aeoliella mucimassa]